MIQFVIPSYQRCGKVKTVKMFPKGVKPHIIVREEEKEAYENEYGDVAEIIAISGVSGISDTRKKIVEMYQGQRIWMMDDDTSLRTTYIRDHDKRRMLNLEQLTEDEFNEVCKYVEDAMDAGFLHGHAKYPVFKVPDTAPLYRENSYGFTNTFYDLTVLTPEQIGFGEVELCEDMYCYLNLVNQGFPHLSILKWMVKTGLPQSAGGCSSIRNTKKHNESLKIIHDRFPHYCRWDKRKGKKEYFGDEEQAKVLRVKTYRKLKSEAYHKFSKVHATHENRSN